MVHRLGLGSEVLRVYGISLGFRIEGRRFVQGLGYKFQALGYKIVARV